MATDAELIREYHEADFEYRKALAGEMSKDELVALPEDVRASRACLGVLEQAERLREARIAFEEMKSAREDRWITAHEYATSWRREGTAT